MLDVVLRHRFVTLMSFFATVALSVYLFIIIPKGFFPNQDTGLIIATTEAAQERLLPRNGAHPEAVRRPGPARSGGRHGRHVHWHRRRRNRTNSGRMFITLKPRDERDVGADEFISEDKARGDRRSKAPRLYLQNAQDITVGGRTTRTQYQYTLTGCRPGRTQRMVAEDPRRVQKSCRSCRTSQPISRAKARR